MPGELQTVELLDKIFKKELGQLRPANTTAATIYSPADNTVAVIDTIIVCNTTTSAAAYRIFIDKDGTTYDQTTALFYDVSLAANSTDLIEGPFYMNLAAGNLAGRTDTNSALTFTAYGRET